MKKLKGKKSIIIICVSLLLIIVGVVLILTGNNFSFIKHTPEGYENSDNNKPDDTKPVIKVYTKSDVMSLLYQYKAVNNIQENWYVGDTALLAHNEDNTKYLVRYKLVLENGSTVEYESVVSNEEGEYKIDYPGWTVDSKDLTEYSFIYYVEGAEGYDPVNQQYNQEIEVGWNSDGTDWSNYQYVPDESWKTNQNW